MSSQLLQVNVNDWISDNQNAFLPPVCNKLMHFSQLLVMFVGGPNTRKDYHIEEGEELFYQLKGDMCLKVIENGKHKDVHIKEGEMFLLPARIPHSPQRQADTVGLVVERRRLLTETDCLRYYVDNSTDTLFERWFYCQDLGTQLVPIIKEFMASKQFETGKPDPNEVFREPPFQLNTMNVMSPFSFKDWLEKQRPSLANGRPINMFGAQFETEPLIKGTSNGNAHKSHPHNLMMIRTPPPNDRQEDYFLPKLHIFLGSVNSFMLSIAEQQPHLQVCGNPLHPKTSSISSTYIDIMPPPSGGNSHLDAMVFGPGLTESSVQQTDVWIWQQEGSSRVTVAEQEFILSVGDSLLIPEQSQYQWQRDNGTVALFIVQNPERKRP